MSQKMTWRDSHAMFSICLGPWIYAIVFYPFKWTWRFRHWEIPIDNAKMVSLHCGPLHFMCTYQTDRPGRRDYLKEVKPESFEDLALQHLKVS